MTAVLLLLWLPSEPGPRPVPEIKKVVETPPPKLPVKPPPPGPRRIPVAGAEGFSIVIFPDGTSQLESPTGKRTNLVDRAFAGMPTEAALFQQLNAKLMGPRPQPRRTTLEQLIVLDEGVVDIPRDAVVTFTAKDRLVALHADGTSMVHYVDGRIEVRARARDLVHSVAPGRKPLPPAPK